ncbi:MAG: hypothetical protein LCI00_31975 [Chloroflexi bacterium]|nr:hypothetical protein [Chloroflexota bacterium]MCC6891986.1 hypothetical protein [Anaerolineae bacterium]
MEPISTTVGTPITTPNAPVQATTTPDYGWTDAKYVMQGVCFEAAEQLLDNGYTIRSAAELERFYSQIDLREYCEQPIQREAYPFTAGDVLVGVWNAAGGCTVDHIVQAVERDSSTRRIAIRLQLAASGDCPYELIRPFWVVVHNAEGYEVDIEVSRP